MIFHEVVETRKRFMRDITVIEQVRPKCSSPMDLIEAATGGKNKLIESLVLL